MYPETHTVRLASKECAYGNQSKAGRGQIIIGLVDHHNMFQFYSGGESH